MTTVDVQVTEREGQWHWGIPGVRDQIMIPGGRAWWESQVLATAAAHSWLANVAEMARADWPMVGVEMEAGEAKIIEAVASWSGLPDEAIRALMEQARWFAEEQAEAVVPSPYVDADGDAPFVALTAWELSDGQENRWERWVLVGEPVGDVQWLEQCPGEPTMIGTADSPTVHVRAPIAEVAVALGLRARDCRSVGAPAEEE